MKTRKDIAIEKIKELANDLHTYVGATLEIDEDIAALAIENISGTVSGLNQVIDKRLEAHKAFIEGLPDDKKEKCYENGPQGYKVKTKQETAICIDRISDIKIDGLRTECQYE